MITDANDLSEGAELEADVCIIGAGAAGIPLALDLARLGRSVTLLVGGGYTPSPEEQDLYRGSMTGLQTFTTASCRYRGLGGSTSAWEGWLRPLEPEDFSARDWIPLSGWPVSYDEIEPYYQRAQRTVDAGAFDYDPDRIARRLASGVPLELDRRRVATRFYRYSPRVHFGRRYQPDLRESARVTALLNGHAVRLVEGAPGGALARIDGRTLAGRRFTAVADTYVLATGGLENPRLLMVSELGTEWVGRCFMEHPHYYSHCQVLARDERLFDAYERQPTRPPADEGPDAASVDVMGALSPAAEALAAHRALGCGAQILDPVDAEVAYGAVHPRHARPLLRGRNGSAVVRPVTFRVEQTPFPENRVTLLPDQPDALGMPRIALKWHVTWRDREMFTRSLEIVGAELGRAGIGRLWMPLEDGAFVGHPAPGCHHIGTTRMSEDPGVGVVDRNCRVHGIDNLFVAGSSVFTTGGWANPTLTIVALAHRLADHLAGASA